MNADSSPWEDRLPEQLGAKVAAVLEADEAIIWVGQPSSRFTIPPSGRLRLFLFFVAAVTLTAFCIRADEVLQLILGICAGCCWLVVSGGFLLPFFWQRLRRRVYYVLTDRRAIISWGKPGSFEPEIRSYTPTDLQGMVCVERPDGTGDLRFEANGNPDSPARLSRGFVMIDNVREVERLLRETLRL